MKSRSTTTLSRSTCTVILGLLLAIYASLATAAKPSPLPPKSPNGKSADDQKNHAADAHRRKRRPATDLDGGEARDTLEAVLENYETMLAVVANNIANAETPAFKRSRAIVEDLSYRQEGQPGVQDPSGAYSPNGFSIGSGSQIVGTEIDFRQGSLQHTGRELDLAIDGQGFFQIKDPSGSIFYSRAGHFSLNCNGQIVVGSAKTGRLLEPAITIPHDAKGISISPEGGVAYLSPRSQTQQQAGTIQMADFINPQGLLKIGENLYQESDGSGACQTGTPGSNNFGKIRQGWIEKSNVDLRQETAEWKRLRRTYRAIRSLLEEE
jgi:flagellar basal-body rod protein FlgG